LLCMARPELLERRPSWAGGKWNATTVLLEPLDADESERLLAELGGVDGELRARIVQTAEGNPLFLEEMLALVRDSDSANVDVPPTIQALLAARLDQLDPAERTVLEHGSVEGRLFHRAAVAAMADGDSELDQRLRSLVRKELVRPDRSQFVGDDAYRFRHLLIRDAAYDALPKSVRADLHRRFAIWLEEHGHDLVELDEILGYHLEQAARYLAELGRPDPELAAAASNRLAAAGRRARFRFDRPAAHPLLRRAFDLAERPDVHLVVDLARTSSPGEAATLLSDAVTRADEDGDAAGAALAGALAASARAHLGEIPTGEQERRALDALPLLEAAEDHLGLSEVWRTLANAHSVSGSCLEGEHAAEQMVHEARLAGWQLIYPAILSDSLLYGPRPVREALERLEDGIGVRASSPESVLHDHPVATLVRAILFAMDDRFEGARMLAAAAMEVLRERGDAWPHSGRLAEIEMLAGNYEAAEEHLLRAYDFALAHRLPATVGSVALGRARVLCALGRYAEAERLANEGRELVRHNDDHAWWRQALAHVHIERGELDEAERLAREAVALAQETDALSVQGDAFYDLAEVLAAQDDREGAVATFNDALECYERKGIIPLARRTRERLAATKAPTA
jgi:tetratricopeptide (TPR) repeat protein